MVTVSSLPIWQAGSEQFYRPCGLVESKLLPMAIEMLTDKVPNLVLNLVPNLVPNLVLQDGPCPACKCSPRRHDLFHRCPISYSRRQRPSARWARLPYPTEIYPRFPSDEPPPAHTALGQVGALPIYAKAKEPIKTALRAKLPDLRTGGTESDLDVAVEIATALVALGEVRASDPKLSMQVLTTAPPLFPTGACIRSEARGGAHVPGGDALAIPQKGRREG